MVEKLIFEGKKMRNEDICYLVEQETATLFGYDFKLFFNIFME